MAKPGAVHEFFSGLPPDFVWNVFDFIVCMLNGSLRLSKLAPNTPRDRRQDLYALVPEGNMRISQEALVATGALLVPYWSPIEP